MSRCRWSRQSEEGEVAVEARPSYLNQSDQVAKGFRQKTRSGNSVGALTASQQKWFLTVMTSLRPTMLMSRSFACAPLPCVSFTSATLTSDPLNETVPLAAPVAVWFFNTVTPIAAAIDEIRTGSIRNEAIISGAARQEVDATAVATGVKNIVTLISEHLVIPGAPKHLIVAATAVKAVIASITIKPITTIPTPFRVVAVTAQDDVITTQPGVPSLPAPASICSFLQSPTKGIPPLAVPAIERTTTGGPASGGGGGGGADGFAPARVGVGVQYWRESNK